MRRPCRLSVAGVLAGLVLACAAQATPVALTSKVAFDTAVAVAGLSVGVLDFEGLAAPVSFASGSTFAGITFAYDDAPGLGRLFEVSTGAPTTSGVNYLGTDDGGVLQDDPADGFSLSFAPAHAVGMVFVSLDTLFDGDITLSVGGTDATLAAAAFIDTLSDGSKVWFLGIVDTDALYTTASISTGGGGSFLYNVDDIVLARAPATGTPEPASVALISVGLLALASRTRRRRHGVK